MKKLPFLPLPCVNKGIDAINLADILHHKKVTNKIPPYFKDKSIPIIHIPILHPLHPKFSIIKGFAEPHGLQG